MRGSWQAVVDNVLRPARPHLERCVAARDDHLASRRVVANEKARAIAACVRRIELSRAAVFAANDGVVPAEMADLEREWRRLSHANLDRGWMDFWARVAPATWIDRKRWRDTQPELRLDAAVALAADVDGVEAAEAAIDSFRRSLASWGTSIGPHVRWRLQAQDSDPLGALLVAPLGAPTSRADDRARRFEREVQAALLHRFPERPLLARDVAHAAYLECAIHTSELEIANPVPALRALWTTGYVLTAVDPSGVTLEIPAPPTLVF